MGENGPGDREWLTIAAAARRLRVTPRAIRKRIERGTLEWKPAGNTGKLVLIGPEDVTESGHGDAPGEGQEDGPGDRLDRLREELTEAKIGEAEARTEARLLRETLEREQARAEERAAALREALEREQRRADRLDQELAEFRRPWWRKLLGR
jgi:hypothetical protein